VRKALRTLGTFFVSGKGASLGRAMLLVLFGFCMWTWAHDRQTPDQAFSFLVIMAGYVFGSKVVARVGDIVLESRNDGGKDDDSRKIGYTK
jgi:hypothetical protein